MDKLDIEYLENCLTHTSKQHDIFKESSKIWYVDSDTLITVARILDGECYFREASNAIDFFEKPYKWESEMQEIVDTYKEESDNADTETAQVEDE
jgi:RIO-like serine/threonine protein kinase